MLDVEVQSQPTRDRLLRGRPNSRCADHRDHRADIGAGWLYSAGSATSPSEGRKFNVRM
jgi:hypothetical protein